MNEYTNKCRNFVESHREGIAYLSKFGTQTEKDVLEKICQIAREA